MSVLSFEQGRTCSVCGSLITDGNREGVGVECRYSFKKARTSVFFDVKERAYSFYGVKTNVVMRFFIEKHKDIKFRSAFKKSFYPSIVQQWEEKGFLSKKQLEICENWNSQKMFGWEYEEMDEEIGKGQEYLIRQWEPTEEETEKINALANKFRHEFRAMQRGR